MRSKTITGSNPDISDEASRDTQAAEPEGTTSLPTTGEGASPATSLRVVPEQDASTGNYKSNTSLTAESLRISQDFAGMVGVERLLTTVPVRKPNRQEWFRVHPEWRLTPVALIELKDEHETYVLTPAAAAAAPGEFNLYTLFPAITRQGVVMLWPVRLPGVDGRSNRWHESAHDTAVRAATGWTRMAANMGLGAYDVYQATADIPEPQWPDTTLDALVEIAFRQHVIDDLDHPVLRRLRGEL